MTTHWLTVGAYLVVALLLVTLELVARFTSAPIPTLGALVRRALQHRSAQFGLLLAWWWIGWHFFVG